jgi:Glycosyl transferases group 1
MKILFLSDLWLPFPGGAEHYIASFARELAVSNNEVVVLTGYESAKSDHELIIETSLSTSNTATRKERVETFQKALDRVRPDCIFVHRFFAEEYSDVLNRCDVPTVEVVHNRKCLRNADLTVYNSQYTKTRNTTERHELSMVFLPPVSLAEVSISMPIDNRIGFVKPILHKGSNIFYTIVDSLYQRKFTVLRGEWQALEDIRVDKKNVEYLEPVKNMSEFYSRCSVVLVPSLSEDAGTIPLECALAGVPCISSKVMGLEETNGGGVFVLRPDYVECWVEEIRKLDGTSYRAEVVDRQKRYLRSLDQEGKFKELKDRIRNFGKRR